MKHLYCLLACILFSCHHQKADLRQGNAEKDSTCFLSAKDFYPNEIFDVARMSVVGDNFVIASMKAETLVHVYKSDPLTLISSFGRKGEGPNDLVLPILCHTTTDWMLIGGFDRLSTFKAYALEGENFVVRKKYKIRQDENPMNDIAFIDSTHLIYNDIFNLQINKLDLSDNKQETLRAFDKDDHRESFFYSNRGHLAVSQKSMAYAYLYKDQIDFMDLNGNIINTVKKNDQNPVISIGPNADNRYCYVNIFATNDFYYVLYRNKTTSDFEKGQYKGDIMEVYDSEGKWVRAYSFDISPVIYAVDNKNKRMLGFNATKEALLIYDLP